MLTENPAANTGESVRPMQGGGRTAVAGAVAAAFLVRIGVMLATRSYLFAPPSPVTDPLKQHWHFGFELGRVARSIAEGQGFGSPFHGWTGPTAWYPPVYPYLLAGVFKVFGVYTPASGMAILTLNSLFAALTCVPIYLLGERAAGRKPALWMAWLWALTPVFFPYATKWAWETALSTLLLMVALWASVRLAEAGDWRAWFGVGALWGAIALTNTSLLSLMPFALGWAWWNSNPTHAKTGHVWGTHARTRGVLLAFAVMLLAVLPWMVRNHSVMGRWIFVRDNFWAELRFGNAEQSRGIWLGWMNPTVNDVELAHYRDAGELQYVAEKRAAVLEFIRRRPAFFLDLCVRRFFFFWFNLPTTWGEDLSAHEVLRDQWWIICFSALAWVGMIRMLWRRGAASAPSRNYGWLLAPALLVYPCLYYIASADPRYRHPIEPVMLILAVYAVSSAREQDAPHPSKTG